MKFFSNTLSFLFALAIMAGVCYGVYQGIVFLKYESQLISLSEPWKVITLTASLIAIIVAMIFGSAIKSAAKIDTGFLYEKRNAYLSCMQNWKQENTTVLSQVLTIYASNAVLKEYIQLQKLLETLPVNDGKVTAQAERMINEIRKDLGHASYGINIVQLMKSVTREHETVNIKQ